MQTAPIGTAIRRPTEEFGLQQIQELQAEATAAEGFYVRNDYDSIVGRYVRNAGDVLLWPLLRKTYAEADVVRELAENEDPDVGFMQKNTLAAVETPTSYQAIHSLPGGQQVKALGGVINVPYYAQSLWEQQGKPYGPQLALKTEKGMNATIKALERCLFRGNATANPLEFNGLQSQMAPGHSFELDYASGQKIASSLRAIARIATSDEEILRGITHIFTSALGVELIENQTDSQMQYMNLERVSPGLQVPSVITQRGPTPLMSSPFIRDTPASPSQGRNYDTVDYWLLDLTQLSWRGVIPKGGTPDNFNPQIFDVSKYAYHAGLEEYMADKRMILMFGTLFAGNSGESIWKLSVKVPAGTIGSIAPI
ncbi:MAG: hypothetical protein HC786_23230 [Richelia sp. CSU_2_1]|nr:hypothetical protein [Richelia sp. CSU_2_1]